MEDLDKTLYGEGYKEGINCICFLKNGKFRQAPGDD